MSVEEIESAECEILKLVQKEYFSQEFESLNDTSKSEQPHVKKSSQLVKLDPVISEGLLKVGGRLDRSSPIPESMKHPIILPKDCHVAKLIIKHIHELTGHSGQQYVLSVITNKYWILKGHAAVKAVLSRCFDCRKRQGTLPRQKMADLPIERISSDQPPFSSVGVDFFGPFLVKRGRCQVKRYGC